jgi:hypothetical protein
MSSVTSIKAGEVFIEVLAKDLTKGGLDKAAVSLRNFGGAVAAVGASLSAVATAGLAGFGAALKNFVDFGSQINDFSARTGVSTDWAQSFKVGAELAGASLSDVEAAIRRMQKTGAGGSGTTEERFLRLAQAIAAIADPSERAKAAMEAFGKSGTKILPMLEGIAKTHEFLKSNGLMLSPEDVKTADELGDAFDLLKLSLGQVVRIIGASIAPAILSVVQAVTPVVAAIGKWLNENRQLVAIAAGVAGVIAALGAAFVVVGTGLIFVAGVAAAIPTVVAAVGAAIAFLVSPIGLAIAAVAALLALLPAFAYVIDSNFFNGAGLKTLAAGFSELWRIASQTIGGIFTAISEGNWDKAGKILWAGLWLVFTEGFAGIRLLILDFVEWMAEAFSSTLGIDLMTDNMKAGLAEMRKEIGQEVLDAQKALDDLTAADPKKKAAEAQKSIYRTHAGDTGGNPADLGARSLGVLSGFAAARISQMGPDFGDAQLQEQKKGNGLLEDILDELKDKDGAEFGE